LAGTQYWLDLLESGQAASIADLAQRVGTDERYVSRLLKLAFLAPDIIDAILDGRQPRSLSLERLKKIELPLSWNAQRTALGFARS
jgi:site-specific DNA recombinase